MQHDLDSHKEQRRQALEELRATVGPTEELSQALDDRWFERVRSEIDRMTDDRSYNDGALFMARVLWDELPVECLERALGMVARATTKPRQYRKTRGELASRDKNQILGAIFEILTLSGLLNTSADVDLYPKVQSESGSDVEARLQLPDSSLLVEMKALGYSRYDPTHGVETHRVGTHSIDSQRKQVSDALRDKLSGQKQLGLLDGSEGNRGALFLSLWENADFRAARAEFEIIGREVPVSGLVVFGSALCRTTLHVWPNEFSPCPLTESECRFLEGEYRERVLRKPDSPHGSSG